MQALAGRNWSPWSRDRRNSNASMLVDVRTGNSTWHDLDLFWEKSRICIPRETPMKMVMEAWNLFDPEMECRMQRKTCREGTRKGSHY
jgi:hypothetical protein